MKSPPRAARSLDEYRPVLRDYAARAAAFCEPRLGQILDRAGPTLLEFADRSENAQARDRFFEAITLIDARRDEVLQGFRREFDEGFARFAARAEQGGRAAVPPDMELDPEELLATENIVIKTNAACFPELYVLSQRLAVIAGRGKLKDSEIPAGPYHLVRGFRHGLASLGLDTRVKIVLYALLHKRLMPAVNTLYQDLNGLLKAAGLLPRVDALHYLGNRRENAARAMATATALADQGASRPGQTENELFEAIIELVSARRGMPRANLAATGVAPVPAPPPTAPAPPSPPPARDEDEAQRIEQIVEGVGVLFEQMLGVPVLPNIVKSTLGYLHTPYLRLALRDRALLYDAEHAARRLFEDMIEAGSLWVDESNPRRGIFPAIQSAVERILQEPHADAAWYERAHRAFRAAMEARHAPGERRERRTRGTLQNREQLKRAKRRAATAIHMLVERHPLPEPVRAFLDGTWFDLLTYLLLRKEDGPDSPAWREAIETAGQLVALFDPLRGDGELQVQLEELPRLRRRIVEGIQRMGSHNHAVLAAVNALLSNPHVLRDHLRHGDGIAAATPRCGAEIRDPPARDEPVIDSEPLAAADVQAMVERLRSIQPGTWFEIDTPHGVAQTERVKLSWVSPLTSTCMFLDRFGRQARMRDLRELARAMLTGRARIVAEIAPDTPADN